MKSSILSILLLIFWVKGSFTQDNVAKKQGRQAKNAYEFAKTKTLVDSGYYQFVANKAIPQAGSSIDLTTSNNFLRITGRNAEASLPFFGRAFNIPYNGSGGGIKFNGLMKEYKVSVNEKKNFVNIEFLVKDDQDSYHCFLNVSCNKYATLSVSSQQRAFISYYGNISEADKEYHERQ